MLGVLTWAARLVLALAGIGAAVWFLGPREPVGRDLAFDAAVIGGDPAGYLARAEARFGDITPGVEKRVLWAAAPGARTPLALVYVHGFSATSEEIRPVPDRVADGLGANLFYTRLTGHGRGGAAMAEASVAHWWRDMAEAMAIGRALGDRVVLITTSTGGTLAALAATEPDLSAGMAGIVFVSPNFRIRNPAAPLLTLPFARHWIPLVAGAERSFEAQHPDQARYWTTRYPTVAVMPLAALVAEARARDYGDVRIPALFLISDTDVVVDPAAGRAVAARWGGPVTLSVQELGPGDDAYGHVLAGDILSPGRSEAVAAEILNWAAGL